MKGMEMMLANMIGLKPDEMRAMIENLSNAANGGFELLKEIAENQKQIIERLERLENGGKESAEEG